MSCCSTFGLREGVRWDTVIVSARAKMKERRENSNTKETRLIVGDHVLVKQQKRNKWSTPYKPEF